MEFEFSTQSLKNLENVHPDLQRLFKEVIKHFNCAVIEGHRPKERQDQLFHSGLSRVKFPDSKHNALPSLAVDVVPLPIDWSDTAFFYFFAGYVKGVAQNLRIKIRWGGDWNSNNNLKDQNFYDLPHFELLLT